MRAKIISALAASLAVFSSVQAEELSISTTVGFESRYIFRGIQFAETSFQPAINLSYGDFYGGVWLNLPVGDDDLAVTPGGEELDFFAGYSTALNDFVTIDAGVTFYTFPDASSGLFDILREDQGDFTGGTVEPYVGFSFTAPLSPSLYFYRDFNFDTFTIQGSVSHSIPLEEKWSIDSGATFGVVVDDDAGGDYIYGNVSVDLSYAVSDDASISAGVRYGGSDIAGGSFIDDSILGTSQSSGFWWGIGFNSSF